MAKLLLILLVLCCLAMYSMALTAPDTLALLDPAEEELSLVEADAEQMDGLLLDERAAGTGENETPLEEGSGEEPLPVEALLEAAAMQQMVEEQQIANGTDNNEQNVPISSERQKSWPKKLWEKKQIY